MNCRLVLLLLAPALCATAQQPLTTRTDAVGKALNEWSTAHTAAGLKALEYEDRDAGHSLLGATLYPGLTFLQPTEEDKKAGRDRGPAFMVRPSATIGNCSMAGVANGVGSLARAYLSEPSGHGFLVTQYLHNNLIVYPEHQDYDPGANGMGGGWGDLFPANTASMLVSQGSSYSDMPFVKAFLSTAAALKPEIQEMLIRQHILMPTLQAIFRQSNKQVQTEADYFTGKAHPPVFDGDQIDELKMITMAQTMTALAVPPLAFFEVTSERDATPGRDFFESSRFTHEKLGGSPVNVARLFRSSGEEYTITLDARQSTDTRKRPLSYRWEILQGRADLIRVDTADGGRQATLHVRWHPPMLSTSGIRTHRVDIGLFVSNGIATSAPAIVSFYMLPNERRFFDDKGRLSEICYEAGNPEMGLPEAVADTRWLAFIQAAAVIDDTVLFRLLDKVLSSSERQAFSAAWETLRGPKAALEKLTANPAKKPEADKQLAALGTAIIAALAFKTDASGTLRQAIETGINAMADSPDLFLAHQSEILALVAKSPGAEAVHAELKRLTDWGVLVLQSGGAYSLDTPPARLSSADRYYLRQLHLTLLSEVLLPGFLSRSPAPLFVDPRLTTLKSWRDVYRYDNPGCRTGWVRHFDGRALRFDAEGRLLDSEDKPTSVSYRENNGHLSFEMAGSKN